MESAADTESFDASKTLRDYIMQPNLVCIDNFARAGN
jgi:hypothetical protein